MRRVIAVVVAMGLAIAVPASASAETRYVEKGGADAPGCTDPKAPCLTIGYAVGQAGNGDTIQIGAGTFTETVSTETVLTFVGAGAGTLDGIPAATVIRGPSAIGANGSRALVLPSGGEVRSLRAEGGKGADNAAGEGYDGATGIFYESNAPGQSTLRLDHVVAVGGNGGIGKIPTEISEWGAGGRGIDVRGQPGEVALSAVDSEFAGGTGLANGQAVSIDGPGASADVARSVINARGAVVGGGIVGFSQARIALDSVEIDSDNSAATIFEGSMTIRRSTILGDYGVVTTASGGTGSTAEVFDSLLISTAGTAAESEAYDEESTSSLTVVGSTIVGLSVAPPVRATHEYETGSATVTLRNSIARHLPPAGPATDLIANGGTIDAVFSNYNTVEEENGGTATAPGSGTNLTGDPVFVDPGKGNFAIQGSSPLIDRGNPAFVGPGELDLAGSPRSLDGNRDCAAAPDMGAFEVTGQAIACDPFPTISGFGMTNRVFAPKGKPAPAVKRGRLAASSAKKPKRGTKFRYTLSEPAQVKIAIERKKRGRKARFAKVTTISKQQKQGRQTTAFSGRVKGKPLKPGRYRATITATDSAGQTSQPRRVTFKVVGV